MQRQRTMRAVSMLVTACVGACTQTGSDVGNDTERLRNILLIVSDDIGMDVTTNLTDCRRWRSKRCPIGQ
jgi:hypothetical protein